MAKSKDDKPATGPAFWKFAGAGASFQAGSSAVDSATIVASLVNHLTGSVYAVGAASAVLRLGWLSTQLVVGFLAQRSARRMPYYVVGAFGRAACLAVIALLLAVAGEANPVWVAAGFLILWTLYAFVSGIVAVPYNDIVGRSIPSAARSRMLAWRFFGGGVMALGVAAIAHRLLASGPVLSAYGWIFALAAILMFLSSISFVSAGEPPTSASFKKIAFSGSFRTFLADGAAVLKSDHRFRLFLYTQWLAGATLMALPFYVITATTVGLGLKDVGILLGAQTAGSLASNGVWGHIGDQHGKLRLLQSVGVLRLAPPIGVLAILLGPDFSRPELLWSCALLFFAIGALVNGMTIGYLGYLMEISPDDKRPAYSAYFNTLASPAALLPLVGAMIADAASLAAVFFVTIAASIAQLYLFARLARWEAD
jgi:MFS family permease